MITLNNKQEARLNIFLKSCKHHFNEMDKLMVMPSSPERGSLIAKELNRINLDFDSLLYSSLNVPIDDLQKVLNKSFKLSKYARKEIIRLPKTKK